MLLLRSKFYISWSSHLVSDSVEGRRRVVVLERARSTASGVKKKITGLVFYSYQGGCFRYECTPGRKEGGLVIKTSNLGDVYFLNVSYKKLLSKLWEPDYFWLIVLMKKCNNIDLMFILLLEHIYLQLNLLSKARKAILWLSL